MALSLGVLSLACAQAAPAHWDTVRLQNVTHQADYGILPVLIADRLGYLQDEGVKIVISQDPADEPAASMFLMGRTPLYQEEADHPGRLKVAVFSVQDETASNDALVVRANSPAASLKDVKDIGLVPWIYGGLAVPPMVRQILLEQGFPPGEVAKMKSPMLDWRPEAAPFSKPWEVAYMRDPVLSYYKTKGLVKEVMPGPIFAGHAFAPWVITVTCLTQDFIRAKPELAARVTRALDRAVRSIRDNPAQAREIYTAYCREAFKAPVAITNGLHYYSSSEMPVPAVQRQIGWYFEKGLIPRRPDAPSLFYRDESALARIR